MPRARREASYLHFWTARAASLCWQEPLSRGERAGRNGCIFCRAKWRLGSLGRRRSLQRAELPRPALSSHCAALTLPVLHADFFAVRARLAFLETHRRHEGRAPPHSPRRAAVCDAGAAHRATLLDETRRHAIRLVQHLDCGDLLRNIFLPVVVHPWADPGSARAERGDPPHREDPFAPRFVSLLRTHGLPLVVALARVVIVGAVTRAAAIKSNDQLCI